MDEATPRSIFVTVLAWIFIVLSGFTTFIAVLQNVMIFLLFPRAEMEEALKTDPEVQQMPAFAQFMASNIEYLFLAFLVLALATFISAIGLLKRKNWARRVFVGLLSFGVLWNLAGFVLQQLMISDLMVQADAPPEASIDFPIMALVMRVFTGTITLAFTILFGWLIWRLMSPEIKTEFNVGVPQGSAG